MTPLELVLSKYAIPIKNWRPYQVETINELALLPRAGHYLDQGLGKTACATVVALYKMDQGADITLCLMPPILLTRWSRWLLQIPGVTVLTYEGSPVERKAMRFNTMFVLMSIQIFKRDYERIHLELGGREVVVIVDEATAIKNAGDTVGKKASDNYKKVSEFVSEGNHLLALTGTPLTTPMDGYAFVKLMAPTIYRNLRQFENIHVEKRDFFRAVEEWKNLDLLRDNMKINSKRFLRQEVLEDLPDVLYDPMFYTLEPAHIALYKRLAEEQLLPLADGGKIDATVAQRLHNCLQQIIVNYDHFSDDPKKVSRTFELIEEVMEELAGEKLVVFSKFRMTNRQLIQRLGKYNAVAAFGDLTQKQQGKNLDRFINDKDCRLFVGQHMSISYGIDGLQEVCHNALYIELPDVPRDFHQGVARLWRSGQQNKVHIRIAVAQGTLQMRKMRQMLAKDELIGTVQRNFSDLRAEIFGE